MGCGQGDGAGYTARSRARRSVPAYRSPADQPVPRRRRVRRRLAGQRRRGCSDAAARGRRAPSLKPLNEERETMITPVDERTASTVAAVARFSTAFDRHDVDGVMAAMTEDCLFENTGPAPDGERYQGAAAVREFWAR